MKPRTHYRSTSAEQLHSCAGCGAPQPSRTMLLSSRGPVCGICAAEADAGPRAKSRLRDAGFDAVLLSSIANLGGLGLVLCYSAKASHSTMGATWTGGFAALCALATGCALAGFRRAQGVLRLAKRSRPALAAAGLSCIALAFCLVGTALFALG